MNIKKLLAITVMALAVFTACEKEDVIEPIMVPTLETPENGVVLKNIALTEDGLIDNIYFIWKEKQSGISYTLYLSDDNSNWIASGIAKESRVVNLHKSVYSFEFNKKYYWKVKATRLDKNNEATEESVESEVFSFSTYITPISNLKSKASSFTYWPDDYEGSAFMDITWEDSPNIEYVEITFEPALAGVEQPIKVEAGKQQCHIEGFNGWGSVGGSPEPQVYEFTVKAYGVSDQVTEGQTFKAQPLTKGFVHDADYNTYVPIKMGDQVWLSSNLRTTHFNNGVEIGDDILNNRGWSDGEHSFDEYIYKLGEYDTYTLNENKGMCPEGFHIPNYDDWEKLERYIGIEDELSIYKTFGEDKKVANILKSEEGWGVKKDGTNANGKSLFFNLKPSIHGATYKIYNSKTYVEQYARYTDKLDGLCTAILVANETIFGFSSFTRVLSADSDGVFHAWEARGVIRCVQDAE